MIWLALWGVCFLTVPTIATIPTFSNSPYLENQQAAGVTINFTVVSIQPISYAVINWLFNETIVAQVVNDVTVDLEPNVITTEYSSRIHLSAHRNESTEQSKKDVQSTLTFGPLNLEDTGLRIQVKEDVSSSPIFVLNVLNCSYATTNVNSTSSCDFDCTANVTCLDGSGSIPAVCQQNATWSVLPVCTESTTVEPTTVSTYTESTVSAVSTVKSPSSLEPTVSPDLTTSPDANAGDTSTGGGEDSDEGLTGGQIAGIVIGVLFGVGLLAGIIVYVKKSDYTKGSPSN